MPIHGLNLLNAMLLGGMGGEGVNFCILVFRTVVLQPHCFGFVVFNQLIPQFLNHVYQVTIPLPQLYLVTEASHMNSMRLFSF